VRGLLFLAACSSSPPNDRHVDRAPPVVPPPAPADAAAPGGAGDVQIRVEWHDVPLMARASPGNGACGTQRPGAVAPTTTWGIPDALVSLDVARAKPADLDARVVLDHCALSPRALIAGTTLTVMSHAEAPAHVPMFQRGNVRDLAVTTTGDRQDVLLPIAGHAVTIPLEPGSVYELIAGDDEAWIVSAPNSYAAVTDGNGVAVLRDVPAGKHAVTAWLPGRTNQSRQEAHGEVTVVAGALAEVTLDLTK
jgi:hypothetical protein